jgi:hypothetical protein
MTRMWFWKLSCVHCFLWRQYYTVCHFKRNTITIMYCSIKINQKQIQSLVIDCSCLLCCIQGYYVARPLLTPLAQKLCMCPNITSQSKSFAAVRKAFSSACPDREVPNETKIYLPVADKIVGECLVSTSWCTFSTPAVKLFCKFLLTNKK